MIDTRSLLRFFSGNKPPRNPFDFRDRTMWNTHYSLPQKDSWVDRVLIPVVPMSLHRLGWWQWLPHCFSLWKNWTNEGKNEIQHLINTTTIEFFQRVISHPLRVLSWKTTPLRDISPKLPSSSNATCSAVITPTGFPPKAPPFTAPASFFAQ